MESIRPSDISDQSPYYLTDTANYVVGHRERGLPGIAAEGVLITSQHGKLDAARSSRKALARSSSGEKLVVFQVDRG